MYICLSPPIQSSFFYYTIYYLQPCCSLDNCCFLYCKMPLEINLLCWMEHIDYLLLLLIEEKESFGLNSPLKEGNKLANIWFHVIDINIVLFHNQVLINLSRVINFKY